jgi:hypothetical protein
VKPLSARAKWQITGAQHCHLWLCQNSVTLLVVHLPAFLSSVFLPQLLHNISALPGMSILNVAI